MQRLRVFVCSNTHWDREWHTPFCVFQMRLLTLFDELIPLLLRDPAYRCYNFDGQTIVLEDFLDLRPDMTEVVRQLVAQGRITVGPWYVLPDEFIAGDEALVRNLLRGTQQARAFGACARVGYLPDMFGHIAQMPQLLRGFGLDNAILWRGISDAGLPNEFVWQAPDGSRVLTHRINERVGYGIGWFGQWPIHSVFGVKLDPAIFKQPAAKAEWFVKIVEHIAATATTEVIYYPHGTDHTLPDADTSVWLQIARTLRPEWEIVHASFDECMAVLREATREAPLRTVTGELRSVNQVPYTNDRPVPVNCVLNGVLATRMDVKLAQHACEQDLQFATEPLVAFALRDADAAARTRITRVRERAWRELLRNQPHDSIGCCSTDDVMRDILTRYRHCRQYARVAREAALERLFARLGFTPTLHRARQQFILLHAAPMNTPGGAEAEFHLPAGHGAPAPFALVNAQGKRIPAVLESLSDKKDFAIRLGWYDDPVYTARVSFDAGAQAGYALTPLALAPGKPMPPRRWRAVGTATLDNKFLRVTIRRNGSVDVLDKQTRTTYRDILSFEDGGDAGDTYTFSPPARDTLVRGMGVCCALEFSGATPVVQRARLTLQLDVPGGLNAPCTARAQTRKRLPVTLEFAVWEKHARLDLAVTVENAVTDHRLRLLVHTGAQTSEVWSEGHFDIQRRPHAVPPPPPDAWIESGPTEFNNKRFVAAFDGARGLAVLPQGMQEHQLLPDQRGALAITLLRCIGYLSQDNLQTRKSNAGPAIPTPDAQMQGTWHYALSIIPCRSAADLPAVHHAAALVNARALTFAGAFARAARAMSLIEIEGAAVSAIKPADDGEGVIVRLWNGLGTARHATVRVPAATIRAAQPVLLDESADAAGPRLRVQPHSVTLRVPAKTICSLRLLLA
jgi:hypothetical protein